jgi:hypothetical protein
LRAYLSDFAVSVTDEQLPEVLLTKTTVGTIDISHFTLYGIAKLIPCKAHTVHPDLSPKNGELLSKMPLTVTIIFTTESALSKLHLRRAELLLELISPRREATT